jgi:hypothetical protein
MKSNNHKTHRFETKPLTSFPSFYLSVHSNAEKWVPVFGMRESGVHRNRNDTPHGAADMLKQIRFSESLFHLPFTMYGTRLWTLASMVISIPFISTYDKALLCNDMAGTDGADLASIQRTGTT